MADGRREEDEQGYSSVDASSAGEVNQPSKWARLK